MLLPGAALCSSSCGILKMPSKSSKTETVQIVRKFSFGQGTLEHATRMDVKGRTEHDIIWKMSLTAGRIILKYPK